MLKFRVPSSEWNDFQKFLEQLGLGTDGEQRIGEDKVDTLLNSKFIKNKHWYVHTDDKSYILWNVDWYALTQFLTEERDLEKTGEFREYIIWLYTPVQRAVDKILIHPRASQAPHGIPRMPTADTTS